MKFIDIPIKTMKDHHFEDLSASFWHIDPSPEYFLHWHDYFTIDLILDGDAIHYTPFGQQKITRGYMHLVMPSDMHYIGSLQGCSIATVRFLPSLLPEGITKLIESHNKSVCFDDASLDAVKGIISAMLINQNNKHICIRLLESLLLILQDNVVFEHITVPNNIKLVTDYLDVHFRENISLRQAAAIASYNQSYFSVIFKNVTGYTYTQYLNHKRLNYACALMKSSKNSLADIAISSGFTSFTSFNRIFKSSMGTTPAKYRKQISAD